MFFLSKCLISFQIKPCIWVAIPVELFNIGVPVVWMDVLLRDYENFSDAKVTKFSYARCSAVCTKAPLKRKFERIQRRKTQMRRLNRDQRKWYIGRMALWRSLEQPQGRSTSPWDIRPRRGVYWAPKAENSGQRGEQGPGENGSTGGHALGVAGASSSQRSTRPTLRPDSFTSWRCGTFSRGQSANAHYSGLEVQKIPFYSRKQICSYPSSPDEDNDEKDNLPISRGKCLPSNQPETVN